MSVCRSWSAVEIDTAKTCHCETFRNLPRLTLQAPSPTFQFFPVPTTKLSTRLRLLGQVGNWLDLGQTRNRLSSNGGETRETTTAGCTCRGADEPSKTTFDKDSKNWDDVKHTFIPGMKRVFNKNDDNFHLLGKFGNHFQTKSDNKNYESCHGFDKL